MTNMIGTITKVNRRRFGRGAHDESGQAIVLGVFTLFILAIMLMMSFNVNQSIHERIRIQQHADSLAYSDAVLQARAFNYFAYTNRAIAAGYSAMATMHAYMAAASVKSEMLRAASNNLVIIAVLEFLLSFCPYPCFCFIHCVHMGQAFWDAFQYTQAADDYEQRAQRLEEDFQDSIRHLNRMVNILHASQFAVMTGTGVELGSANSSISRGLRDVSAPQASHSTAIGLANAFSFACAIDMDLGLPCGERLVSDREDRQGLMAEVAHGSRAEWTANRTLADHYLLMHPEFVVDLITGEYQPAGDGMSFPIWYDGTAKMTDEADRGQLRTNNVFHGQSIGAHERGVMFTTHRCLVMAMPYGQVGRGAWVFTDRSGGDHNPDCQQTHTQFAGIYTADSDLRCGIDSVRAYMPGAEGPDLPNCFIKFRPDIQEFRDGIIGQTHHFGQPPMYAGVTQDLSLNVDGERGPWDEEIGQDGVIKVSHGSQGDGELTLRSTEDGVAVSKALTYYHRPGHWQEQPNFFNPYWRAKLHPFEGRLEYGSAVTALWRPDMALVWEAINLVPPWN